jgi:hypothetical protein
MDPTELRVQLSAQSLPLSVLRVWLGRELAGRYRELTASAQLVVTELVTNVYQHAPGPAEVTVRGCENCLRIAVTDVHHVPLGRPRCGLRLVACLAHRWGVDIHNEGKTVWAELSLMSATGPDDPHCANAASSRHMPRLGLVDPAPRTDLPYGGAGRESSTCRAGSRPCDLATAHPRTFFRRTRCSQRSGIVHRRGCRQRVSPAVQPESRASSARQAGSIRCRTRGLPCRPVRGPGAVTGALRGMV